MVLGGERSRAGAWGLMLTDAHAYLPGSMVHTIPTALPWESNCPQFPLQWQVGPYGQAMIQGGNEGSSGVLTHRAALSTCSCATGICLSL